MPKTTVKEPGESGIPILPVVLSGGSGLRLWPLSRADMPKQMLALWGAEPMIVATIRRLRTAEVLPPILVCGAEQESLIASSLADYGLDVGGLLLEPAGRNTAPAVAVAALHAIAMSPDALLIVQPADHAVTDIDAFHDAIQHACRIAVAEDKLVLLGARPTRPETGYGYIECGEPFAAQSPAARVTRFVEKPNLQLAEQYAGSDAWLWNMGTFVFTAKAILEELALLQPELLEQCRMAFGNSTRKGLAVRLEPKAFSAAESISIDHGVMEKSQRLAVVPVDCGWTDLGSWSALWEIENRDANGNFVSGSVECRDTERSYLRADTGLLVSIGLKDAVVVSTQDAVLVADKSRSQDVKAAVEALREKGRREVMESHRTRRPWGHDEIVAVGKGFRVKRMLVEPGAQIPLQQNSHRTEQWIIVQGTAAVQVGDDCRARHKNESVLIPRGATYCLTNNGSELLELIAVQIGENPGKDDIVRLAR
jgi:mannose-1-phosphate guanylyltransferase / mannose-6-phosphate isomerase